MTSSNFQIEIQSCHEVHSATILYNFVQIGSHIPHTPSVDHELWSRSRVTRASVEPPSGHTDPKLP
jgi:hypothetical protein